MKAPIKGMPAELNRRLDELDRDINIDDIIAAVLEQIVIPPAPEAILSEISMPLPEGLNQQFLIYNGALGEWLATYINDFRVRGTLYVNSDYVSGDEDATIYFNAANESLVFDYGDDRFEFSKGIYSPNDIEADGNVHIDKAGDNAAAYLYFRAGAEYLLWDQGNTRFQLSDELFVSGAYLWVGSAAAADRYLSFQDDAGFHSLYWRNAGYWQVLSGASFRLNQTDLHIDADYTSGDVDATIYFLATNHYLKFDYGNDRFEMDKDLVANSVSIADHSARHENGGGDEISVAALSGELADLQPVKDHTHQSAGSGVGGKLNHGLALDGLTDDDHSQYFKVTGRSAEALIITLSYIEMDEMTEPDAPGANKGRIFMVDNGGKTAFMVRFPSGVSQQIAIEP